MFLLSLWVKDDFNIAIDPLIEFLKGSRRLREWQAMRNDKTHQAGFRATNQVPRHVLSGTVIRKKRHESAMSIVIESGLKRWGVAHVSRGARSLLW